MQPIHRTLLRENMSGDDVRRMQQNLRTLPADQGGSPDLKVDSRFGPETLQAVFHFQMKNHCDPTGIFGAEEEEKLQQLLLRDQQMASVA